MTDGDRDEPAGRGGDRTVAALSALAGETIANAFKEGYTQGKAAARTFPKVEIDRFVCPWCAGGHDPDAQSPAGCLHCGGKGLTNDVAGWEPHELTPAPRPPAVMDAPCGDCAYRRGSPEDESFSVKLPGDDEPFFCHYGLHEIDGLYSSTAYMGEVPLGAMLCASWWDRATGGTGPTAPYRERRRPRRAGDDPPAITETEEA